MSYKPSYAALNSRNIYDRITNKCAFFLCIDALDFKKLSTGQPAPRMKMRFCTFNSENIAGAKITGEVNIYIPLPHFLLLCHDVLNGTYAKRQMALLKQVGEQSDVFRRAVYFENFGGTTSQPITSVKLSVVNGMGEIPPCFAFVATSGPGELTSSGGIVPVKNKKPEQSIFINMPNDDLKEMCLIGRAYAEQYVQLDLQSRLAEVQKLKSQWKQQQEDNL